MSHGSVNSKTKACTTDGCSRFVRARGLCSTHYNQAHQPDRHKTVTVNCAACDQPINKGIDPRRTNRFCSLSCRSAWGARLALTGKQLVGPVPRAELPAKPAPVKAVGLRVWVSGDCAWCDAPFTCLKHGSPPRYCSPRCLGQANRATRRAREKGAGGTYTWAELTRVWLTIGKACAYCHEPKTNDEIEPDHVVPLSKGGSNSITNIVPSCHECNGHKRDLLLADWVQDRTARGLVPRALHPAIRHLTCLSTAA